MISRHITFVNEQHAWNEINTAIQRLDLERIKKIIFDEAVMFYIKCKNNGIVYGYPVEMITKDRWFITNRDIPRKGYDLRVSREEAEKLDGVDLKLLNGKGY